MLVRTAKLLRLSQRLASGGQLRRQSSWAAPLVLRSRAAVLVKGDEATGFLQGLMTNDVNHLESHDAIYSMFLNVQGRILFDSLVFKSLKGQDEILIDCHKDQAKDLIRHLKMYKLRKKIDVRQLDDVVATVMNSDEPAPESALATAVDPRVPELGRRSWLPASTADEETDEDQESWYRQTRYTLGVAEGPEEIRVGQCFPLEYNADYMHGVSFHKGCYIGQELTARVHHVGVVRKRIMPLKFLEVPQPPLPELDTNVVAADSGKRAGKLRGLDGQNGIGLIRVADLGRALCQVKVGEAAAEVWAPSWWPVESPKTSQKGRGASDS